MKQGIIHPGMLKVAIVSTGISKSDAYPNPSFGGQVQIWGLAREMARLQNSVYLLGKGIRSSSANGVQLLAVRSGVPDRMMAGIISQVTFSMRASGLISRLCPDVIMTNFRFSAIAVARLPIPKCFTLHVPEALDFMKSASVKANPLNLPLFYLKRIVERDVISRSDVVVVQNSRIRDWLISKGLNDQRVRVIPNAVDLSEFPSRTSDDFFILFVGRLDWNKRASMLVDAYARLPKRLRDCYSLKIVGTGYNMKRIKEQVLRLGLEDCVELLGNRPRNEVLNLMSRCSILALASMFESCPVVVLEAMACGKAVVASDIPGPQDMIRSGYSGLLFDGSRLNDLSEALECVLDDSNLRLRLGRNARREVEKRYTFSSTSRDYLALAEYLINQRC